MKSQRNQYKKGNMKNQYDISICLKDIILNLKQLVNQTKFIQSVMEDKYTELEVYAIIQQSKKEYLKEILDTRAKRDFEVFINKLCQNFIQNHRRSLRGMPVLIKQVQQFQKNYQESKKNSQNLITSKCQKCGKEYTSNNGLSYHNKKKKCGKMIIKKIKTKKVIKKKPNKINRRTNKINNEQVKTEVTLYQQNSKNS